MWICVLVITELHYNFSRIFYSDSIITYLSFTRYNMIIICIRALSALKSPQSARTYSTSFLEAISSSCSVFSRSCEQSVRGYDRVGRRLGKKTKAGAIDGACEFTEQIVPNLERALDHPDMTPELAEILSAQKCASTIGSRRTL